MGVLNLPYGFDFRKRGDPRRRGGGAQQHAGGQQRGHQKGRGGEKQTPTHAPSFCPARALALLRAHLLTDMVSSGLNAMGSVSSLILNNNIRCQVKNAEIAPVH